MKISLFLVLAFILVVNCVKGINLKQKNSKFFKLNLFNFSKDENKKLKKQKPDCVQLKCAKPTNCVTSKHLPTICKCTPPGETVEQECHLKQQSKKLKNKKARNAKVSTTTKPKQTTQTIKATKAKKTKSEKKEKVLKINKQVSPSAILKSNGKTKLPKVERLTKRTTQTNQQKKAKIN